MPKAPLFTIPRLTPEAKRLVRLASTRKPGPKNLNANLNLLQARIEALQASLTEVQTKMTALVARKLQIEELRDSGLSISEYLKSHQTEKLTLPTILRNSTETQKSGKFAV